MVQADFPAYALSIHKQNALRITEGNNSNKIGPKPIFYSNTNVHLVDINVFTKSDEIPSLPVQNIKNQNGMDKELQKAIILTKLAPCPYFSILNVHLVDINVFAKSAEIHYYCLFKLLRKNQNIED